jgi:hypothetical protein
MIGMTETGGHRWRPRAKSTPACGGGQEDGHELVVTSGQ